MVKTTHITISSTEFQLVEAAYERLARYLGELATHFRSEDEGEEIMRDIESRIAEKLLESKHRIITLADVESVIAEIGDISQLESESNEEGEATRKLYRDPDNAILAGVAAGISAYLGIDAILIRLIFVASVFFGGMGIAIYLLLWFIIPEAKSASQKLQMRGSAVTLEAISKMVKEKSETLGERGTLRRIFQFPFEVIGKVARFARYHIFPAATGILGFLIAAAAVFGLIALAICTGIVLMNWDSGFNDFALRVVMDKTTVYAVVTATCLSFALPLVLALAAGVRLWGKRALRGAAQLGILAFWTLSVVTAGLLWAKIGVDYAEYVREDPARQVTERAISVAPFNRLELHDVRVTLRQGAYAVDVSGEAQYLDTISASSSEDSLVITWHPVRNENCFFSCGVSAPRVTITAPNLESISIESGTMYIEDFSDDALALEAKDGASISGSIQAEALTVALDGASMRGEAELGELSAYLKNGASLNLSGFAKREVLRLLSSRAFNADLFADEALIDAQDSYVRFSAATTTIGKNIQSTILNEAEHE